MNNEEKIQLILAKAMKQLGEEVDPSSIVIERSKEEIHGDYASNIALKSAKLFHLAPKLLAEKLLPYLEDPIIDKVEIAGPGFINFFLKKSSLGDVLHQIIQQGEHFGEGKKNGIKVNVEYVSANPTGDLHLGHTRGAALGDAVSNLYEKAGYEVTREYYVNDCGNQVRHLGNSLRARYHELFGEPLSLGDDDYHGLDLIDIAKSIRDEYGDRYLTDNEESERFFIRYGIDHELAKIKKDLADFGVKFDVFTYESDIRKDKKVEKTYEYLDKKGYIYEEGGAKYLKTSAFLDDKDRPIVKSDGNFTYFLPDIAYHYDKLERGYDFLVDMLGADHHGYINRMKSALMMKGASPDTLQAEIYQIVRVYKDGEEVKMSKRTGKAITHRELVEMVGKDAVRYFFTERASGSHLDFNLDLALSRSKDNPVYYAQYAHARCASLLKMGEEFSLNEDASLLTLQEEGLIMKQLAEFPSMIQSAAKARAPYKVANFCQTLAGSIHEYYQSVRIIDRDNSLLTGARLYLVKACQIVMASALALLGVSAPNRM